MYCGNCGGFNPAGTKFCTKCGTPLVAGAAPIGGPAPPPPQYSPGPPPLYPPQAQYPPPQHPSGPAPVVGQYPPPPVYVKKRSPCGCCLAVTLLSLLLVCGGGATLWFLIQNGAISGRQILSTIGMGPGEINVVNLTDGDLQVTLTSLETNSTNSIYDNSVTMTANEIRGFANLPAGRYKVAFTYAAGTPGAGECTIKLNGSDYYQYVAVPEGIAVSSKKEPAQSASDVNIESSSLCKR